MMNSQRSIVNRTKPQRKTPYASTGLAQLSVLEHSLCPLDVRTSLTTGLTHESRYPYTGNDGIRRSAAVRVHLPLGLSSADEFTLWGLLALTLRQPQPTLHFAATPHYCLRQLGVIDAKSKRGGKNYQLFRESLRRLAAASYECDGFYDPIRAEHVNAAFGFLSYRLPISTTSDRLWHFYWDPVFFEFCSAVKGSLLFDLPVYRQLSPGARRLFLLLHKVFYRRATSPDFDVRTLAIHTLGFSDGLTLGVLNRKLNKITGQLTAMGIITEASRFQRNSHAGIRFHRGRYFSRSQRGRQTLPAETSSLADALISLGFETPDAGRITSRYDASLLRDWIDITIAAKERFGNQHFKRSPQAFLMHHLSKAAAGEYSPPDWWQEIRKQESRNLDSDTSRQLSRILKRPKTAANRQTSLQHISKLLKGTS